MSKTDFKVDKDKLEIRITRVFNATPERMWQAHTDPDQIARWWDKTVVEEPPGEKQIDYHENSDQWVPRGDVLRCIVDDGGPDGEVVIFALNRGLKERLELTVDLRAFPAMKVHDWSVLRHANLKATNTQDRPDTVKPVAGKGAKVAGGTLRATLAPASWNVLRLRPS